MINDFRLMDALHHFAIDTQVGCRSYGRDVKLSVDAVHGGFGKPSTYTVARTDEGTEWKIVYLYTHHYDGPPYSSYETISAEGDPLTDMTRLADERDAAASAVNTMFFMLALSFDDDPDGYDYISWSVSAPQKDLDKFFSGEDDDLELVQDIEADFGVHDFNGYTPEDGPATLGFLSYEVGRDRVDDLIARWRKGFTDAGLEIGETTRERRLNDERPRHK